MTQHISPMGKTRLQVESGSVIHPSSRQHTTRLSPQAPPELKASRPTRISKDGRVLPQLKLHDLSEEQMQRVRDILSNADTYSPDDAPGSLGDLVDGSVSGALGHIAQMALDGNDEAADLLYALEADASQYAGYSESDSFWSYYETPDEYR